MARAIAVGTIAISTTTLNATHTINLPSEFATAGAPNYLRFWIVGRTDGSNAVGLGNADLSVGVAKSATQRYCYGAHIDHNTASSQTGQVVRNDAVIALMAHSGTPGGDGLIDISSISASQVVLINDSTLGHGVVIGYEIATVNNVAIGTIIEPGSTGNLSVTGLSFQPTHVEIFGGTDGNGTLNQYLSSPQFSFGVAHDAGSGTIEQAVFTMVAGSGSPNSAAGRYTRIGEIIAGPKFALNDNAVRAEVTSYNSDGFTLNFIDRNSTRDYVWIATDVTDCKVDSFQASTSNAATRPAQPAQQHRAA